METIWIFDTTCEADLARIYLEDHGFEVALDDYNVVAMDWLRSNAFGGIKLKVKRGDMDRALGHLKELMNQRSQRSTRSDNNDPCLSCGNQMHPDEDTCPNCGWTFDT